VQDRDPRVLLDFPRGRIQSVQFFRIE